MHCENFLLYFHIFYSSSPRIFNFQMYIDISISIYKFLKTQEYIMEILYIILLIYFRILFFMYIKS